MTDSQHSMDTYKKSRRVKLIQPRLQLKLIGSFVGLSALTLLLQFLVIGHHLSIVAEEMPEGSIYLTNQMAGMLMKTLGVSFGMLLPLTFAVGVLVTFRIAGPVHRFERYLEQVARGETSEPCKLRQGDELTVLCDRINEALAVVRAAEAVPPASGAPTGENSTERESTEQLAKSA